MKLAVAQEAFLEDLRARALRKATLDGYLAVFRLWLAKAEAEGKADLEDWDAAALRAWRSGWACSPGTHGLRLSKLKAFFRFAVDEGWLAASPAKRLRPPRNDARPTLPLTLAERRALVLAASSVSGSVRAFVLLRRYSGLAIQDAATLARERLEGTLLTLRRGKSGELVQLDLPDVVAEALAAVDREGPHYFWTGRSQLVTAAKLWARCLTAVGQEAQEQNCRTGSSIPHLVVTSPPNGLRGRCAPEASWTVRRAKCPSSITSQSSERGSIQGKESDREFPARTQSGFRRLDRDDLQKNRHPARWRIRDLRWQGPGRRKPREAAPSGRQDAWPRRARRLEEPPCAAHAPARGRVGSIHRRRAGPASRNASSAPDLLAWRVEGKRPG